LLSVYIYNSIATCGGFRICTAGYVVQQLSHSNYLKQSEVTGRVHRCVYWSKLKQERNIRWARKW